MGSGGSVGASSMKQGGGCRAGKVLGCLVVNNPAPFQGQLGPLEGGQVRDKPRPAGQSSSSKG